MVLAGLAAEACTRRRGVLTLIHVDLWLMLGPCTLGVAWSVMLLALTELQRAFSGSRGL